MLHLQWTMSGDFTLSWWLNGNNNNIISCRGTGSVGALATDGTEYSVYMNINGDSVHLELPNGQTRDCYHPQISDVVGALTIWEVTGDDYVQRWNYVETNSNPSQTLFGSLNAMGGLQGVLGNVTPSAVFATGISIGTTTTSAAQRLHIEENSTSVSTYGLRIDSTGAGAQLMLNTSGSGYAPAIYLQQGSSAAAKIYSQGNAHDLRFSVNNSDKLVFPYSGSPTAYFPSGRVGIGSSTPNAILGIDVTAGFNGNLLDVALSNSSKFIVTSSGRVGLSTTTPWKTLSVTGTVGIDGLTGSTGAGSLCLSANKEVVYNSGSDSCLSSTRATKHDITPLDLSALDMVTSLQPVSFVYNNDASSTVRYGFIAEDAAAVDAHLATYDAAGAISGIDDRSVIALTVRAVQSLISTISEFADRFTTRDLTFTRATGDEITVRRANIQQANVQELCVGSTCLTESQVQALLNQAGQQPSAPSETPQEPETEEPQADEPILPATAEVPEETDSPIAEVSEPEEPGGTIPEASDAPPTVPVDTPEDIPVTESVDPAAQ
jgi:hypothetical protein